MRQLLEAIANDPDLAENVGAVLVGMTGLAIALIIAAADKAMRLIRRRLEHVAATEPGRRPPSYDSPARRARAARRAAAN